MSAAYMFQAAFLCAVCAEKVMETTSKPEGYDADNESSWDSDDFPKGPYDNGGGEADYPQHCDHCGVFLENSLTGDGENYVREKIAEGHDAHATRNGLKIIWRNPVVKEWAEFYDMLPGEVA